MPYVILLYIFKIQNLFYRAIHKTMLPSLAFLLNKFKLYIKNSLSRFCSPLLTVSRLIFFLVTYSYICFSMRSSEDHPSHSTPIECSPTRLDKSKIHSFGNTLNARLLSTHDRSTSELLRTL